MGNWFENFSLLLDSSLSVLEFLGPLSVTSTRAHSTICGSGTELGLGLFWVPFRSQLGCCLTAFLFAGSGRVVKGQLANQIVGPKR